MTLVVLLANNLLILYTLADCLGMVSRQQAAIHGCQWTVLHRVLISMVRLAFTCLQSCFARCMHGSGTTSPTIATTLAAQPILTDTWLSLQAQLAGWQLASRPPKHCQDQAPGATRAQPLAQHHFCDGTAILLLGMTIIKRDS